MSAVTFPVHGATPFGMDSPRRALHNFQASPDEIIRIDMGRGKGHKRSRTGNIARNNVGLWQALVDAYVRCNPDIDGHVISLHDSGKRLQSVKLDAYYRKGGIDDVSGNHIWKHTCCTLNRIMRTLVRR